MAYFSKNPIYKDVAVEGAAMVRLDLYIESAFGEADYSLIHSQRLVPDVSGNCRFRLETVLDAFLESERASDLVEGSNGFSKSTKTARYFRPFTIRIDSDGTEHEPVELSTDLVILGAYAWNKFPTLAVKSLNSILHNRPSPLTIRQIPNYLSIYSEFSPGFSKIEYTFYAADGTPRVFEMDFVDDAYQGITHKKLDQWPLASEKSIFQVRFIQGVWADPLGPFLFNLDRSYSPIERVFIFRNAQSGFETFVATGIGVEKLETDRTVADRIVGPDYSPGAATQFIWQQESQVKMKVNSGWFPNLEQAKWLAWELMLSTEVYELIGEQRYPVVISTKSLETFQDENFLSAIAFEYAYAFPILAPSL